MRRRLLPQYVSAFRDRHGKERLRFRRTGYKTHYFVGKFGTEEFRTEYRACLDGDTAAIRPGESRIARGTVSDLLSRYYRSQSFLAGGPATQRKNRGLFEGFREQCGDDRVSEFRFEHLDAILAKRAEKYPAAARNLRKQLRRLFQYAVKIEMIDKNPVEMTERVAYKAKGHHTWTEDEIAQFEGHHAIGSNAFLAMRLMLWTGARKGDAVRIGPANVKNGEMTYTQEKTGKTIRMPVAPQLAEAILAIPPHGGPTFLMTAYGKPFTSNGFGNRFRAWCDEAGLPQCSAHGLRKAISRRLAELETANKSIKSVTGHSKDDEITLYTAAADQRRLASATIRRLAEWDLANRANELANQADKHTEKE